MKACLSLRISALHWMDSRRTDALLALIRDYRDTLDEVAFFTGFTHPPVPLAALGDRARRLAELIPAFKALGVGAGINHLATLGHLDENLPHSLNEPWQHLVDISGRISKSCYCPSDPRMQAYIRQCYGLLAAAHPDFIWVDDDIRLESHAADIHMACFCERCLERFATETHVFRTREQLVAALNGGTLPQRLELRRQWLEHNRQLIAALLALIREAVDTVDRTIPLGLMTGEIAYSGYGFEEWAAALGGIRPLSVKWRPGGGFYSDDAPLALLAKAHSVGRQVGLLPESVMDVQWEHENFPYQYLKKSRRAFVSEAAAGIGAGCTGVALNVMGTGTDPFDEFRPYFDAVRACRPAYDKAVEAFGRSPCTGVWCAFTRDRTAFRNPDGDWAKTAVWGAEFAAFDELAQIGLPFAYARNGAAVSLLSGDACLEFSREALMAMLSGGALLDGPALARLNEMGLHDYTGFAVRDRVEKDTVERLTDDPLNGAFAGWHRDCRPSFWPETSWVIEPALPGARVLAEVQDFTPRSLGAVAGCVENALGGRVAVLGYYPWRFVQVLAKTAQLKALCRWLSRDTLPAYVRSFHRVALWCRQDHQGRSALMLLNASLDAAERVQVCLRGVEAVSLIRPGQRTRRLRPDSEDGPYAVFTLPRLEPWDFATALPAT